MSPLQIALVRSAVDRFMELQIMMGPKSVKEKNAKENDTAHNDVSFSRSYFLLFMPDMCLLKLLFEFGPVNFLSNLCYDIHFGKRRTVQMFLVNHTLEMSWHERSD